MHGGTIRDALEFYDSKKGFLRRIFGDSEPIKQLRIFYQNYSTRRRGRNDDLRFTTNEESALMAILVPEQNNHRLTGVITNNLLKVLNQKLTDIGNLLRIYEIPLPKIDSIQINKDHLEKILQELKSTNRLNQELIIKILARPDNSACLARILRFVPNFSTEQLVEMIDSNWYEPREIQSLVSTHHVSEEQIRQVMKLNDPESRTEFLQQAFKNQRPCYTAKGSGLMNEFDWQTLGSDFPSRFNVHNFFSTAAAKEENPVLDWICSPIKI